MVVAAEVSGAQYVLVDSIPQMAADRAAVRVGALAMLEERRHGEQGDQAAELLPVDALSTANHVLVAEHVYGHDSPERAERWGGLVLDCDRLVREWYRKLTSEYFEPTRHIFDPKTEEFFSHGLSIRQMTENALVPMPDRPEEEDRRVNECVEDATPQIVRKRLGRAALDGMAIRTISECSDWALDEYTDDMENHRPYGGYAGYVPETAKIMLRDISLGTETDDRFEEQVGLPGEYITEPIIQEALQMRNLDISHMSKTERHGAQMLAGDSLMDFVALLDTIASRERCVNIFMGEKVDDDFVKDYDRFKEEALQRQKKLRDTSETVATYILDLADEGMDRRLALTKVEEFVKLQLLNIGKNDIGAAKHMFGLKTVQGLKEVIRLELTGQYDAAFNRMQEVQNTAEGGGYCGAGSCGIESVNLNTEEGKTVAEKLRAEPGDTIVKDKDRKCKCGSNTVFYAYNKNKVNKYCSTCTAFESKVDNVKVA